MRTHCWLTLALVLTGALATAPAAGAVRFKGSIKVDDRAEHQVLSANPKIVVNEGEYGYIGKFSVASDSVRPSKTLYILGGRSTNLLAGELDYKRCEGDEYQTCVRTTDKASGKGALTLVRRPDADGEARSLLLKLTKTGFDENGEYFLDLGGLRGAGWPSDYSGFPLNVSSKAVTTSLYCVDRREPHVTGETTYFNGLESYRSIADEERCTFGEAETRGTRQSLSVFPGELFWGGKPTGWFGRDYYENAPPLCKGNKAQPADGAALGVCGRFTVDRELRGKKKVSWVNTHRCNFFPRTNRARLPEKTFAQSFCGEDVVIWKRTLTVSWSLKLVR